MHIKKLAMVFAMLSLPSIVQADEISEVRAMLDAQAPEVSEAMATLSPGNINLCVLQSEVVSTATKMRLTGSNRPEAIQEAMAMNVGPSTSVEHSEMLRSGVIARVNEVYDLDIRLSIPLPTEEAEQRARLVGEDAFNNCIKLVYDHKQATKE
jgi:hypothetical protein